jgi:glyoxylase-like metal-dependent hydrolase (beta-lactamase superfamily II)
LVQQLVLFEETLDGLGNAPLKTVTDTHWHFDHTGQ